MDKTVTNETTTYNPDTRLETGGTYPVYKTVNHGIAGVDAGGTVNVRTGIYYELAQADTAYKIAKNMTIQAYNSEAVTLTYPADNPPIYGDGPDYGFLVSVWANVTLDGIVFIGMRDEGEQSGGYDVTLGITQYGQGTIKNCTFRKAGHAAIKYAATAGNVIIEKNIFEDTGHTALDHHIYISEGSAEIHTTIRHNVFDGAAGYGIHLYDRNPQNVDIYGNVIINNGNGGILLGGTGHNVVNNTICNNSGYGGIVFWKEECAGNVVKNNIIRGNSPDILMDDAGANTVGYNNKHTLEGSGYDDDETDLDADPLFVDVTPETWDDYRLSAESPMIDAGADVGAGFIAILDPASTTRPATKEQGATREIGAFTI